MISGRRIQVATILGFCCGLFVLSALYVANAAAPQDALQHELDLTRAALARGDLKAADEAVRKALHLNPASAQALHLHGLVLLKSRKPTEAAEEFARALKVKPAFAEALNEIGRAHV